ncbi:MAG TPA: translation factor GTPase family protein [Chloroflexota bacterium]|nr:translation factor GTPase family protein [Chloroflexota bacterium]
MRYLNLGILAHVDAGKTTLTERLLYTAGVIDRPGSVDRGTTQTDFLPLERQRGITIRSAVVSFAIGDLTVNLIDTPGHPDFIAEVERVLSVLDGAVLVISAVEGVQAQTRVLLRTLRRLRIPTLIFVNKIDRSGAAPDRVLCDVAERLTANIVAMGEASNPGDRSAGFNAFGGADAAFFTRLVDLLAANDDALLAHYLEDEGGICYHRLRKELAVQTARPLVHPVYFGSAVTGAGVPELMDGIAELLPATAGDSNGPLSGAVFKIERGPAGEKVALVRLFSGTLRTRDRLRFGREQEGKVTALSVFEGGPAVPGEVLAAGRIGRLWGLPGIQIGDRIGVATNGADTVTAGDPYFAPPTLETAVLPCCAADKAALHLALAQLAEQDPLINLRQDDRRGEMYVSLYGEVQKEVIEATLAQEYGLAVHFRETSVICIERPTGSGEAVEWLGKNGNPFLATIGLRVEPAPEGTGVEFRLDVELVTVPLYIFKSVEEFQRAMEDTVRITLQQGLYGWQVADCRVTMTASGYASPASGARDFRRLTPLVLMAALQQATTRVAEPIHRFHLEIPASAYGTTMPVLARLGAAVQSSTLAGPSCLLEGEIPATRLPDLQHQLPAASRGEGVLEYSFGHYRPVEGSPPTRPRSDLNPLNRKEYLLHVVRHV